MKFTAEITLRTVPFEAQDADDAREMAAFPWHTLITSITPSPPQVVEVQVFEVEEID